MKQENKKQQPVFDSVKLDEDELTEKKLHLMQCEIQKDSSDIELEELIAQLDAKIPMRFLEDDIAEYTKNLKTGKGKEDKELTEADKDFIKIQLDKLKKKKKLDLPMKELRLRIQALEYQKGRIDAPEQQINKLKKEIRTGRATVLAQPKRIPTGV